MTAITEGSRKIESAYGMNLYAIWRESRPNLVPGLKKWWHLVAPGPSPAPGAFQVFPRFKWGELG